MNMYDYKGMIVTINEEKKTLTFTAKNTNMYPALIEEMLLDSDKFEKVYNAYPILFQSTDWITCFDYDMFYKRTSFGRVCCFNEIMQIGYSELLEILPLYEKSKNTKITFEVE